MSSKATLEKMAQESELRALETLPGFFGYLGREICVPDVQKPPVKARVLSTKEAAAIKAEAKAKAKAATALLATANADATAKAEAKAKAKAKASGKRKATPKAATSVTDMLSASAPATKRRRGK